MEEVFSFPVVFISPARRGNRDGGNKKGPGKLYRITVEPTPRNRVRNQIYSAGKLNVCHGLIDCKNPYAAAGREKIIAKLSAIHALCHCNSVPAFPVSTVKISLHMCAGPFNTDTSFQHELRARNSVTESLDSTCVSSYMCVSDSLRSGSSFGIMEIRHADLSLSLPFEYTFCSAFAKSNSNDEYGLHVFDHLRMNVWVDFNRYFISAFVHRFVIYVFR